MTPTKSKLTGKSDRQNPTSSSVIKRQLVHHVIKRGSIRLTEKKKLSKKKFSSPLPPEIETVPGLEPLLTCACGHVVINTEGIPSGHTIYECQPIHLRFIKNEDFLAVGSNFFLDKNNAIVSFLNEFQQSQKLFSSLFDFCTAFQALSHSHVPLNDKCTSYSITAKNTMKMQMIVLLLFVVQKIQWDIHSIKFCEIAMNFVEIVCTGAFSSFLDPLLQNFPISKCNFNKLANLLASVHFKNVLRTLICSVSQQLQNHNSILHEYTKIHYKILFPGFHYAAMPDIAISRYPTLSAKVNKDLANAFDGLNGKSTIAFTPAAPRSSTFKGFQTAAGRNINVSLEALQYVQQKFHENDKAPSARDIPTSTFQKVKRLLGQNDHNSDDQMGFTLFSTASDLSISSTERLTEKRKNYDGFNIASVSAINISPKTLIHVKKKYSEAAGFKGYTSRFEQPDELTMKECDFLQFQGFQTAAGKAIDICPKSLDYVKKKYSEAHTAEGGSNLLEDPYEFLKLPSRGINPDMISGRPIIESTSKYKSDLLRMFNVGKTKVDNWKESNVPCSEYGVDTSEIKNWNLHKDGSLSSSSPIGKKELSAFQNYAADLKFRNSNTENVGFSETMPRTHTNKSDNKTDTDLKSDACTPMDTLLKTVACVEGNNFKELVNGSIHETIAAVVSESMATNLHLKTFETASGKAINVSHKSLDYVRQKFYEGFPAEDSVIPTCGSSSSCLQPCSVSSKTTSSEDVPQLPYASNTKEVIEKTKKKAIQFIPPASQLHKRKYKEMCESNESYTGMQLCSSDVFNKKLCSSTAGTREANPKKARIEEAVPFKVPFVPTENLNYQVTYRTGLRMKLKSVETMNETQISHISGVSTKHPSVCDCKINRMPFLNYSCGEACTTEQIVNQNSCVSLDLATSENQNLESEFLEKTFTVRQLLTIEAKSFFGKVSVGLSVLKASNPRDRSKLSTLSSESFLSRHSIDELLAFGVKQSTLSVNSSNSRTYVFGNDHFESWDKQLFHAVGDGAFVILNDNHSAGIDELFKAFLCSPNVDSKLISREWFANHYRWIVWKLASMEFRYPSKFGGRYLSPSVLMQQMKLRYDWEIDGCKRSAIRKIIERDDTPEKTIVLFVSEILHQIDASANTREKKFQDVRIKLSDGWYEINTEIDSRLIILMHEGKIQIGTKLIISAAKLIGPLVACSPLEVTDNVFLKINVNATRRARWDSKLGYFQNPMPFPVSLKSLYYDGGFVGQISVLILRKYPLLYCEKYSDHSSCWRNDLLENEAQDKYEETRGQCYSQIVDSVRKSMEQLKYDELHNSSYLHAQMYEEEVRRRVDFAISQATNKGEFPAMRNVSRVLKVLVKGCHDNDQPLEQTYVINIWHPSDDLLNLLTEGEAFKVFYLVPCRTRVKELQFSTTKKTVFEKFDFYCSGLYSPKEVTPLSVIEKDLNRKEFVVDTVGLVFSRHLVSNDSSYTCDKIYICDSNLTLMVVKFREGLPFSCYSDILKVGNVVCLCNLQLDELFLGQLVILANATLTTVCSVNPKQVYLQEAVKEFIASFEDSEELIANANCRLQWVKEEAHARKKMSSPSTSHDRCKRAGKKSKNCFYPTYSPLSMKEFAVGKQPISNTSSTVTLSNLQSEKQSTSSKMSYLDHISSLVPPLQNISLRTSLLTKSEFKLPTLEKNVP